MAKHNFPRPAIMSISAKSLLLCSEHGQEPLVFDFESALVSDIEIISRRELTVKLRAFLEERKVRPSPLVVIFNQDVYYEKDFPGPQPPLPSDMEKFTDTIPFSSVSSKLFRVGEGFKQIVVNRDFYESIKITFESLGFKILAIVPDFVLGPINIPTKLTASSCRLIHKKLDYILDNSFSTPSDTISLHEKEQAFLEKNKIIVIALVLGFVILAGVVAFFTLPRSAVPAKKLVSARPPAVSVSPKVTPEPSPTVTVAASPSATPVAVSVDKIKVQILNASGVAGQATALDAKLKAAGFKLTQTGNAPTSNTDKTFIAVKSGTDPQVQDLLLDIVKQAYPNVTLQQVAAAQFDAIITLGKNTPLTTP